MRRVTLMLSLAIAGSSCGEIITDPLSLCTDGRCAGDAGTLCVGTEDACSPAEDPGDPPWQDPPVPPAPDGQNAPKVVIVVIDGVRYSEQLGDPEHRFIPRIWNDLRPQGTLGQLHRRHPAGGPADLASVERPPE